MRMYSIEYSIELDRTGFPLITRNGWDFAISLFPVSKYQFERFMVMNGKKGDFYTDRWYRELLKISPRRSWRGTEKGTRDRPWELFLTGVSFDELTPFLRYLGRNFRLPEAGEWKALLEASMEIGKKDMGETGIQIKNIRNMREADEKEIALPVRFWIEEGLCPLVEEGILEIVMDDGKRRYMGRPFQALLPNTWNPQTVREVNWDICREMVGFRVVKGR